MAILHLNIVTATTPSVHPYKVTYTAPDGSLGVLGWGQQADGITRCQAPFASARGFACKVQEIPGLKALYKTIAPKGVSIYQRAMGDFLHAPQIISVSGTSRKLTIVAVDDVVILYVYVEVFNGNELVDKGFAAVKDYHPEWTYAIRPVDAPLAAISVRVTAVDIPGNATAAGVRFRSVSGICQAYIVTPV